MKQPKEKLKTYFETGDKPTEQEFCDLIDSYHHQDSGIIVTDIIADQDGKTKITFSDGASVNVGDTNTTISVNNKIRVVDLGVIRFNRSLTTPTKEDAIVAAINALNPPLVVAEDEQIIFEFDLQIGIIVGVSDMDIRDDIPVPGPIILQEDTTR